MSDTGRFHCFVFWGGGNRLALPTSEVLHVDEVGTEAPNICGILGMRIRDKELCTLRLGDGAEGLPLEVGGPVDILEFEVKQVLLNSAKQGGRFIDAIIEDKGELILLLDAEAIKSEVREQIPAANSAETKATK